MQKRRPVDGSGAVLLTGDEQAPSTTPTPTAQPLDDLRALRAMVLIQRFSLSPETAAALSLLAFGGAG